MNVVTIDFVEGSPLISQTWYGVADVSPGDNYVSIQIDGDGDGEGDDKLVIIPRENIFSLTLREAEDDE